MASRLIIPFNNCPSSTAVRTASYTIPSGKYAKIYNTGVWLSDSLGANPATQTKSFPSVQIDGAAISGSLYLHVTASSSTVATRTITYPVDINSQNIFASAQTSQSAQTLNMSINRFAGAVLTASAAATTVTATETIASYASSIQFQIVATNTVSTNFIGRVSIENSEKKDFWIPSGTVITIPIGTGRYILEEYNNIS